MLFGHVLNFLAGRENEENYVIVVGFSYGGHNIFWLYIHSTPIEPFSTG